MDAREDLPKVSIETEQDWRRIQQDLSAALLARLDGELESHGQSGDKDALLPHVHQFLETLFDIARPNLRINGRTTDDPDGEELEEDMEPFDEALDRHIWSLSDQRLKWDKEMADRRRSKPQDIEKMVVETFSQHQSYSMEASEDVASYSDLNPKDLNHELQHTLANTLSLVPQISQTLKTQQSRVNKITAASAEVKALKP